MLDSTGAAIWRLDSSTSIISLSPDFKTLHGREDLPNKLSLQDFLNLMPSGIRLQLASAIAETIESGKRFELHYSINCGDHARPILHRGAILAAKPGKSAIVMGTCKLEEPQHPRESRTDAQREEYMGTLFHDLKNPLLSMTNVLKLIREGRLGSINSDQDEALANLIDSNQQLVSVVQNALEVYRYERSSSELTLESTDVTDTLSACVSSIATLAKDRQVEISTDFKDGPMMVLANNNSLRRLWQNIIDNALKFTPNQGRIYIRAWVSDALITVEIEDTGHGIEENEQQMLFRRFKQSSTGKQYISGSGLGLYLCKKIVQAHGGDITCRSKRGIGTVFCITLPEASAGIKELRL